MIGWFTWFRGRDGNAHLPADESYPNSRSCQQSRAIPPSELQAISRVIGKGRGEVGFRGRWSGRDRPGPLPGVRGLIMRLVGTILMPTGQAYEVYNDHPGADPGDVEKIASLVSKASAAGKPVFFSDGYRVLAVSSPSSPRRRWAW